MGKVILIASGKGGTGKTMFTVNLGATLSQMGYRVVLLDYDMGLRNLDLYLGLENQVVYDVYDVLTGMCRIKQALVRDKRFDNLYLMAAAPTKDDGTLTPLHMKILCEKLVEHFDFVIVDGPPGLDDGLAVAAAGAEEAIIVTNAEYSALRDADMVDSQLSSLGIVKRHAIINKVMVSLMKKGFAPSLREINAILRTDLIGAIQYDENIHISTNLGIPIVGKKDAYIEKNFKNIARRILTTLE